MGRYDTIGHDIVNHCINDVLVQGARPLFFLDYIATSSLDPEVAAIVVGGMAGACRAAGCALLGGETAEMPDVYVKNELDVVGTIVGVVDRDQVIDHSGIAIGDTVIAIKSSGLHTNGFSLARQVFQHWDLHDRVAALGDSLGMALLQPHRSYLSEVMAVREAGIDIHSLVHVTGGGLIENPARVLAYDIAMRIDRSSWEVPPLFALIQSQGNITEEEMFRTFNMGAGMLVVVDADEAAAAVEVIGPDAWRIGEIVSRTGDPVELS
jgi:phosphoribosylformylglycinamidine cyclo-ligase